MAWDVEGVLEAVVKAVKICLVSVGVAKGWEGSIPCGDFDARKSPRRNRGM